MKLRFALESDAEQLLNIYTYYVDNTVVTFDYKAPTIEEFKKRINKIISKFPFLVAQKNDTIVGYAYVNTFKNREAYDHTVELSIYVDKENVGLGIGKLLYNKLEKILCEQNIVNITSCITYPNEQSEIFHKSHGYEKVAHFHKVGYKFNKWYDVVWYEKSILSHSDSIGPVKSIHELAKQFD
ncbi:N-acetyltransferase family protein [Gemella sp. GH3]|nr:N-acetyltransferase [Gemella sp. GH3.1]NYS50854.1 N-acetyltransferase family protein [Gemella sp. GH3]